MNLSSLVVLSLAPLLVVGCASLPGGPNNTNMVDKDPSQSREQGNFVLGPEGVARGANPSGYIPRNSRNLGFGSTASDMDGPVFFQLGKSELTHQGKEALTEWTDKTRRKRGESLKVTGHTDSSGSGAFNQKLSEERAKAVRTFLATKGYESSRVQIKGFGEEKPISSNENLTGRAENRRVVIEVLEVSDTAGI